MIKVGRGIGAGLDPQDQLFGGDGEAAGEIGHVVVDRDGDLCHCGRYGCLETVASAPAIIRHSGAPSLEDWGAAPAGDDDALATVRRAGRAPSAARSPTWSGPRRPSHRRHRDHAR